MSSKTSQLQIRVSPEQKEALKRLAASAGRSVSSYVLATVLPPTHLEFGQQVRAVRGASDRRKALSDFSLYLSRISQADFASAIREVDLDGLSLLLQNYVAAMVEDEARARGSVEPAWSEDVEAPSHPHFAWDLRSLRPHLLRVTPAALKRRNVYAALAGPPQPTHVHSDRVAQLSELSSELARVDVLAELCVVGGAVMIVAFTAKPPTRRMRSLFQKTDLVRSAASRLSEKLGLPADWLNDAARSLVQSPRALGGFYEDQNLRIFAARPDYTLAMKVACGPYEDEEGNARARLRGDVRYLLRFLDIHEAAEARRLINRYFNERQVPPDVDRQLVVAFN
jgi:hypothetical protein